MFDSIAFNFYLPVIFLFLARELIRLINVSHYSEPPGKKKLSWILSITSLFLMLFALSQLQPRLISASALLPGTPSPIERINVPFSENFVGRAFITVGWKMPLFAGSTVRIIPDEHLDALYVNGRSVDLSKIDQTQLGDFNNGVELDLQGYITPGDNILQIAVSNQNGRGGVSIDYLPLGWHGIVPWFLLVLGGWLFFVALMPIFGLDRDLSWIVGIGIAMVVLYWFKTPFALRQFDVFAGGGHLDYIRYILDNHTLPPPDGGWEYHQPPLYYLLAANFYALGEQIGWLGWVNALRWFSFLLWIVFITAGLAVLQKYLKRNVWILRISALGFCCWPAGIIHSIRIGNDVCFYACYAVGLWAVCQWWTSYRLRWFAISSIFCLFAITSKASGLGLLGTLLALLFVRVWRAYKSSNQRRLSDLWRCTFWLVLTQLIAFFIGFYSKVTAYLSGRTSDLLMGNAAQSLNSGLAVANDWSHMLGLDWVTFLQQPWLDAWNDVSGRQYFWNYLLRSSITSEFNFSNAFRPISLVASALLLLLVLVVLVRGLMKTVRMKEILRSRSLLSLRSTWQLLPVFLGGGSLLILVWMYRFRLPYSCHAEFRLIYPSIICFIVLACSRVARYSWLRYIGTGLVGMLGVCGILLVLFL